MTIAIAQYVDLLFKKLQGVAKTANSTTKGASNESIASPAFVRGDVVWMQADQISATAVEIANISNARINGNSVECTADITVPPISGIRPTWLSNVTYWIPQEFGSTWLPKIFVGPPGAANIQTSGTQIFAAGISGAGEYFFDTQSGVLNFIGETIPSVLTSGNVVYISGYEYIGAIGVTNNPGNLTVGNLTIANTTISTSLADGNITLSATGNAIVEITGTAGVAIPSGNTAQRPDPAVSGTLRFNNATGIVEVYTGSIWKGTGEGIASITNQTIDGDGSTVTFTLDQAATAVSILVTINGINQTPGIDYDVTDEVDITFTTVPITSDVIQIRFISQITTVTSVTNTSGNTSVSATTSGNINFEINNSTVAQITNSSVLDISASHSLQLPTYTVAEATGLSDVATGQVIYVSNGANGLPCLAVYSGGWKQVAIGNIIAI